MQLAKHAVDHRRSLTVARGRRDQWPISVTDRIPVEAAQFAVVESVAHDLPDFVEDRR